MILSRRNRTRTQAKEWAVRLGLIAGGAAAGCLAALLDRRRRNMARDRAAATVRHGVDQVQRQAQYAAGVAKGAAHRATEPVRREEREYDDVTLARRVESELFRPAGSPKGDVSVNVQYGVVELRGQVQTPELLEQLAAAAARVDGVRDVHNLLHTPGSPPKHSPPSEPADVRARAR